MPIFTKPNNFIFKTNIAIINEDLVLTSNENLLTSKEMEFLIKNNFALDWYTEDLYNYSAALLKTEIEIPKEFTLCPIRKFFFENKKLSFIVARARSLLLQRKTYKFCPTCATKLEDDKTESALFCPLCKEKFFPRIEPATITLISKGDEILLAKAKRGTHKKFACISGFVEQGETIEECVIREVKEETNLEIKNIKYIGSRAWPFPDQLMFEFTAEYASGELKIQEDEIEEAKWFNYKNLPPLEQLPAPGSSAYNLIFKKYMQ